LKLLAFFEAHHGLELEFRKFVTHGQYRPQFLVFAASPLASKLPRRPERFQDNLLMAVIGRCYQGVLWNSVGTKGVSGACVA
jgi:hypothetical protein